MKKNIYKILFAIVCMFMAVGLIVANSATGTGTGSTTSGGGSSCTEDVCLPNSNGPKGNYLYGIRLSFHTSDGTRISSKDYIANNAIWRTTYTQYGSGGTPCSKIDKCANAEWKQTSIASTTELTNIFNNSGIYINIDSILQNRSLSKNILFSQILSPNGVDLGKQLFLNFGIDYNQYYKSNIDSYDLFLVWEPLGSITYKGNAYVGTAHELLTFIESVPGTYGSGNWTAYQYVSNYVTTGMGCAVNLDDSDIFGNAVSKKFGNTFSSRSYFGGKLDASEAGTIAGLCNAASKGSAYRSYVLNNDKGFTSPFAIGILWFDEIGNGNPGISCTDVDSYYGGSNKICNDIISNGTFDFSAFNRINSGNKFPVGAENGITKDWYVTNCCGGGSTNGGIDCTPTYNVPSCTVSGNQTLTYKDSTDWQHCIFTDENNGKLNTYTINPHKWSSKTESLSYYDENLSSQFCDVYCIEEINGNFDSNNPTVLAGNHFIWGWSKVNTVRTCTTKEIRFSEFEDALNRANQQVANQLAQNQLRSENNNRGWTQGSDVYDGLHGTFNCQTQYNHNTGGHSSNSCTPYNNCTKVSDSCNGQRPVETCSYTFVCQGTYKHTIYTHNTDTYATVTVAGIRGEARTVVHTTTSNKFNPPTHNPVSGGNVQAAMNEVTRIINEMNKCYEFNDTNVLNDQSQATISYISPNNVYDYSGNMKKNTSVNYDNGSCNITKPYTTLNNCSVNGTSCSNTTTNIYNCISHTEIGNATTTFSLEDGVYQYVIKNPNNLTLKSVHSSDFESVYKNSTSPKYNWTSIGYSNFPVPYFADAKEYSGSLQINYSNLGHTSIMGETDVDTILKSVTKKYGDYGDWSCGYTVESDLIPERSSGKGDIDVIYREIDLYNPFPDTNSKGRHTGANWCDIDSCDYDKDNKVVNSYILQNRNVTGDELYGLEPMYTFIMTPSDIIKIRRYNEENTYSSYDGNLDGKKYTFTCTRGSLRNCRSDYLSQLLTDLDATNLPGTCKNDRQVYQGDTASSRFEKCRY